MITEHKIETNLNSPILLSLVNQYQHLNCSLKDQADSINTNDQDKPIEYLKTLNSFILALNDGYKLNIKGIEINFNDNFWDLSALQIQGIDASKYRYYFTRTGKELNSEEFNILIKLYTLYCIDSKGLNGQIMNSKDQILAFLFFLESEGCYRTYDITLYHVTKYLDSKEISYSTKTKLAVCIKLYLSAVSIFTNYKIDNEIFDYLSERNQNKINAIIEQNKTPLLPSNFYSKFTEIAYNQFIKCADLTEKKLLGLIYIQTQTGLRISEVSILEKDCLKTIGKEDYECVYMEYRTTKTARNKNYDYNKIPVNKKTITVINHLKEISADLNTNLLVPNNINGRLMPYRSQRIDKEIVKICINNYIELDLLNRKDCNRFCRKITNESTILNREIKRLLKNVSLEDSDYISIPQSKQFRVYVSTDLHNRGLSDRQIAKMLGHTTTLMYGYYTREVHPIQEDIEFSKEIVEEIVTDDLTILGNKGNDFKNKINEVINENNFSVETDLQSIIDKICMEMPIRSKLGGFCVKSNPRRECRHDANTDEYMCAYNCCPNHCHLYFMAPIAYSKCKEQLKILEYDLASNFKNAAQKEAFILKNTIIMELEPELNEIKKIIDIKGKEEVLTKHSDLATFVNNIDAIEKEIQSWKKTIQSLQN